MQAARALTPLAATLLLLLCGVGAARQDATAGQAPPPADNAPGWEPLFDGRTLTNWEVTQFYKPGVVQIGDGQIILEKGSDLTGITWNGSPLPTTGYELALEAMRVEGTDFFAGITFPVDDSFCTLILGGWGGSTVGLSSINGFDAAENRTTRSIVFEDKRWYDIRLRVTPARIEAWLDGRQIIDQDVPGYTFYTRIEVDASQPLGVASWQTRSAIRSIRLRRLPGAGPAQTPSP